MYMELTCLSSVNTVVLPGTGHWCLCDVIDCDVNLDGGVYVHSFVGLSEWYVVARCLAYPLVKFHTCYKQANSPATTVKAA